VERPAGHLPQLAIVRRTHVNEWVSRRALLRVGADPRYAGFPSQFVVHAEAPDLRECAKRPASYSSGFDMLAAQPPPTSLNLSWTYAIGAAEPPYFRVDPTDRDSERNGSGRARPRCRLEHECQGT
jgi:hypothetical protein